MSYQYNGIMVYTTDQLSEILNVNKKTLHRNFQRNKIRYAENIDYIVLYGAELKKFKENYIENENFKFTSILYLWTVSGCKLLAKSSNSELSWEMLKDKFN